ncbi:hypothetical protein V5F77_20560 [Xanthobacter sp. DSM 24535]|uniref:hypothetical protein n=1 Tax=Roseixanthobacter psychrophilus TaxID=3119917 RepID=UPI00372762DE
MPIIEPSRASAFKRTLRLCMMLSCVGVLAAGCQTDGKGTAPAAECRGRTPILLTRDQVAAMPAAQLAPITAHNEQLEAECGIRPPNPSGQGKG